jgi:hypothetical protein
MTHGLAQLPPRPTDLDDPGLDQGAVRDAEHTGGTVRPAAPNSRWAGKWPPRPRPRSGADDGTPLAMLVG